MGDFDLTGIAGFQSTLSVRRATRLAGSFLRFEQFQSTLSVRRATFADEVGEDGGHISIHALREESDVSWSQMPRASRLFQSTLSVRRATLPAHHLVHGLEFQSTLSVRRATMGGVAAATQDLISIHALREESDSSTPRHAHQPRSFQSTLSVRRATFPTGNHAVRNLISIHALREESDHCRQ